MKNNIHPKFYPNSKVTCSCGNTFETGSTLSEIQIDICSACHPFFTGDMKFIDTQGRVERFMAAVEKAKAKAPSKSASDKEEKSDQPQKTLKEMMEEVSAQTKAD